MSTFDGDIQMSDVKVPSKWRVVLWLAGWKIPLSYEPNTHITVQRDVKIPVPLQCHEDDWPLLCQAFFTTLAYEDSGMPGAREMMQQACEAAPIDERIVRAAELLREAMDND